MGSAEALGLSPTVTSRRILIVAAKEVEPGVMPTLESAGPAGSPARSPGAPRAGLLILLVLLILAAWVFSIGLTTLPLLEPDEGRNAEVAREMISTGDWITPHYDSLPYLDKPAEYFWLVAASFRVVGTSEGSARLPSILAALATICLLWLLAASMFPSSAAAGIPGLAFKAGIIFATTPLVVHFAHIVILDMVLTFLVSAAMVCFWLAAQSGFRRRRFEIGFFLAMGLAFFEKGPVGVLLPLLSILVYEAIRGQVPELGKLRWGAGALVFLVTALPWYAVISIRHPDYLSYAVFYETLARFATGSAHRGGGVFYYVPVYLGGFLPWSFFLLFAAGNRVKRWKSLRQKSHKAELYLTAWALVTFVFFSISHSKLPGYVLPAAVPIALLAARVWQRDVDTPTGRRPDWLTAGFGTLILVGIVIASLSRWPGLLGPRLTAKIPPMVVPILPSTLLASGVILAALGFLGRNAAHRLGTPFDLQAAKTPGTVTRRALWSAVAFVILALSTPLLLLRWLGPIETYAAAESSRELGQAILASPEKDLPLYGYYYFRTSLPYYLGRPVGLVTTGAAEITSNYIASQFARLRQAELAPGFPVMISGAGLEALSATSPKPFLVMAQSDEIPSLTQAVGVVEPLWTSWQYSIVKVPAAGSKNAGDKPAMIDKILRR